MILTETFATKTKPTLTVTDDASLHAQLDRGISESNHWPGRFRKKRAPKTWDLFDTELFGVPRDDSAAKGTRKAQAINEDGEIR